MTDLMTQPDSPLHHIETLIITNSNYNRIEFAVRGTRTGTKHQANLFYNQNGLSCFKPH